MESITEIRIKRKLLRSELLIFYKKAGRVKDRVLLFEKNKEENMKNILLSEKLIDEQDIKLNENIFSSQLFVPVLTYIVLFHLLFFNKTTDATLYFGVTMLLMSVALIIETIYYLNAPLFKKSGNHNVVKDE